MATIIQTGDLVTYSFAILFTDKVYRYITELPHGMALCEDNEGNRWRFSRKALCPATEEQKKSWLMDPH